jgi:hypothetical protein
MIPFWAKPRCTYAAEESHSGPVHREVVTLPTIVTANTYFRFWPPRTSCALHATVAAVEGILAHKTAIRRRNRVAPTCQQKRWWRPNAPHLRWR